MTLEEVCADALVQAEDASAWQHGLLSPRTTVSTVLSLPRCCASSLLTLMQANKQEGEDKE